MEEMQITSELTWIEVQFMKKAVDEVEKCRMTLKWTYAMAYYLDKGNEKELFEDNQRWVLYEEFLMSSLVLFSCCIIFGEGLADAVFYLRDLEKAVEDLSELLESPIEAEHIPALRQKVTDKTVSLPLHFSTPPTDRSKSSLLFWVGISLSLGVRAEAERDRTRRHCDRLCGRQVEMELHRRRIRLTKKKKTLPPKVLVASPWPTVVLSYLIDTHCICIDPDHFPILHRTDCVFLYPLFHRTPCLSLIVVRPYIHTHAGSPPL